MDDAARAEVHPVLLLALAPERDADVANPHCLGDAGPPPVLEQGAEGGLVLTHLRHRAAPLLRFRTRDHVVVRTGPCRCGRTGPRIRCVGRTDDMLIVPWGSLRRSDYKSKLVERR